MLNRSGIPNRWPQRALDNFTSCRQIPKATFVVGPLLAALAANVWAQPRPIGGTFQVNSTTSGYQYGAAIAVHDDGSFVVAWTHEDGSLATVHAQQLDRSGMSVGTEVTVVDLPSTTEHRPSIATAPDGEFVIAYRSVYGSYSNVYGNIFDAGGGFQAEFTANYIFGEVGEPTVDSIGSEFLVVWESQPDESDSDILGRRIALDGVEQDLPIPFNNHPTGNHRKPDLEARNDGSFVVVWNVEGSSPGPDPTDPIVGHLGSSGTPLGVDFQINETSPLDSSYAPDVSGSGRAGEFAVVWADRVDSTADVRSRVFSSGGQPIGTELLIDSGMPFTEAAIGTYCHRGYLVAWIDADFRLRGQLLDRHGARSGSEFRIDDIDDSEPRQPKVADLGSCRSVVVWDSALSNGNDPESSIQARLYDDAAIFADGFESGNTLGWSATTP